ncbi:hypothetical protein D3C78_1155580 [compost metagenome]
MSTAPREPKNGQARPTTTRASTAQRWVEGRVRKLPAPLGTLGRRGMAEQAPAMRSRVSCQTNMASAQAAMAHRVRGLAPCTSTRMPTVVSLRPSTG